MIDDVGLGDLLETAVVTARAAGGHALKNVGRRHEVERRSSHDVKLRMDVECQARAEEVIRGTYPGHHVFGEEGGEPDVGAEYLWVVDPIDGTVNYHHGLPLWGTSIACLHRGEVVAGAVYLPVQDECYTATVHGESACNGEPIHVSRTSDLRESLVATGLSRHIESEESFNRFGDLVKAVQKVRVCGAAVYDLCMVASGRADGYYEASLNLWDWAAGGLIVQRAGGVFEVVERLDAIRGRVVSANPKIFEALRELVGAA